MHITVEARVAAARALHCLGASMSDTDDEDPKKPHDRVIPRKGASQFEDEAPWRHCEDEQRDTRRLV